MHYTVEITHRFELPAGLTEFFSALATIAQASIATTVRLPVANTPGAAGVAVPLPDTRPEAPALPSPVTSAPATGAPAAIAQYAALDAGRPAQTIEGAAPVSVPAAGKRRSGRPTNAEKAQRAAEAAAQAGTVAQQIPTVQPSVPVQPPLFAAQPAPTQPVADPFARAAQPVAPAANADPFARATQPAAQAAPFNPPAGSATAPAIPAASQQGAAPTSDDLKRAFEHCLVSANGEAKVAAVMGRAGVTYVNQLQPAHFATVITDLLATANS